MKLSFASKFLGALSAVALLPTVVSAATFVKASGFQSPTAGSTVITRIKSDSPGVVNGTLRWTRDNVYILDRLTFVGDGVNLIIEPGTLIRGEQSTTGGTSVADPADCGALIITRGSKIIANGTAQAPIIWTSIEDPFVPGGASTIPTDSQQDIPGDQALPGNNYSPTGATGQNGLALDAKWGGLILLGNAKSAFNRSTGTEAVVDPAGGVQNGVGASYVEGFQSFQDGAHGGTNDDDNSGVVRFSSFRYGGFVLSTNNEINGITFGSVGRGTVIEFCEVYNNADDDFEFFGGTVNAKYLAGLYGGDDGFDTDEGYRGSIQFGFQLQNNTGLRTVPATATGRISGNIGDSLSENDGPFPIAGRPFSVWRRYNFTQVGVGPGGGALKTLATGLNFKENGAGKVFNSIVTEAEDAALAINGPNNGGTDVNDAASRVVITRTSGGEFNLDNTIGTAATEPDLVIKHNMFWKTGSPGAASEAQAMPEMATASGRTGGAAGINFASSRQIYNSTGVGQIGEGNTFGTDPLIVSLDRLNNALLNPTLQAASTARTATKDAADDTFSNGFFTSAKFKGAFKDNNWLAGWSHLENMNILTAAANTVQPVITLGRSGTNPSVTFTVEADKSYSVEKSTDQKTYTPIATGTIAGTGTLYKGTVTATGAGSVTVADTTSTLAVGTPVYYRVITQ